MLPPDNPCYSCGCKPSEVQLSLEVARNNIELVEKIENLEAYQQKLLDKIAKFHSGELRLGREVVDSIENLDRIEKAEARGREEAAKIVDTWHIKKGGYSELAFAIRGGKEPYETS